MKTLILAIIILAALTAAVWAGLHFYQKSQRARGALELNQRLDFASAINRRMLRVMNSATTKENNHGFIA